MSNTSVVSMGSESQAEAGWLARVFGGACASGGTAAARLGLWAQRPLSMKVWAWGLIAALASGWLVADSNGSVGAALSPWLRMASMVALWRLPVRYSAHAVLFCGILFDNPNGRPGAGLYDPPLMVPGRHLYLALSKTTPFAGVAFTGMEVVILTLLLAMVVRTLTRDPIDGEARIPMARPLWWACVICAAWVVLWEVKGIGTGGNVRFSMLQMRPILNMPLLTLIFAYAFKRRADLYGVLGTLCGVAVVRNILCIYYYFTVVRHAVDIGEGGDGSYVTTHADALLAAIVLVICVTAVFLIPRWRTLCWVGAVAPVVALGMLLNNRRIAFVGIALGLFCVFLASTGVFRRRLNLTILAMLPFMLVYIAVGWNARGGWAKPVQILRSVTEQDDASSETRDIENYNLIQTTKRHPFLGWGFGHMYLELVQAYDISGHFEAYRYVPHNSVLWLWTAGGWLGYSIFWLPLAIGVMLARRAYGVARFLDEQLVALGTIGAVVAYGAQAYGDMGHQSWMATLMVSSLVGITGSMATGLKAWPYEQVQMRV